MQFEKAPNHGRTLTQDDWKRTQVRMPQDLYSDLMQYAEKNNISLNSAMIELMDRGLEQSAMQEPSLREEIIELYKQSREILEALQLLKEKPTA